MRNFFDDCQDHSQTMTLKDGDTIPPIFDDQAITVCYSCSDNYVPILAVSLHSLISNASPADRYDLVVFESEISVSHRNLLNMLALNRANVSLRFADVSAFVRNRRFQLTSYYTPFTYYRFLIPLLMSRYDKVLYLDSDTVVRHNVAEIFRTDLFGFFVAGANDLTVMCWQLLGPQDKMRQYFDSIGLAEPGCYMQAGVSLYNVAMFNQLLPTPELLKAAEERCYKLLDQDIINILCRGKIKILPLKWNTMTMHPENVELYEKLLPAPFYQAYLEARNDPYIVHYSMRLLPCYAGDVDLFYDFWNYARETPFYEILLKFLLEKTIGTSLQPLVHDINALGNAFSLLQKKVEELNSTASTMMQRVDNFESAIASMRNDIDVLKAPLQNNAESLERLNELVVSDHAQITALLDEKQTKLSFPSRLKKYLLMPLVDIFFPRGSRHREKLRAWYLKMMKKER